MTKEKLKEKKAKGKQPLAVFLLCSLFFVLSCENMVAPKNDPPPIPAEKGSFSLTLSGTGRTILPDTLSLNIFAVYNLAFTPTSAGEAASEDRTNETLGTDPIYLVEGTYNLVVKAYTDTEKEQLAARGTLNGIAITTGQNTPAVLTLRALLSEGEGSFRWEITFPADVTAEMIITPTSGGGVDQETVDLNQESSGSRTLNSGEYSITFNLEKPGDDFDEQLVVWNELLYVYQSLDSVFRFDFTDDHFSGSVYTVTYDYDDDDGHTANQKQSVLHGGTVAMPIEPTRAGFTFNGWWYKDGDALGNAWNFDDPVIDSITLYARWSDGTEANPIPLSESIWADGSITSNADGSAVWYSFYAESGRTYYMRWNDSKQGNGKTLDVKVSSSYSDGTSIFANVDSAFATAQSFIANRTGTVLIKVDPFTSGSTGTFAVLYTTSSALPYTVSFNANGGNGAVANITINAGSNKVLPSSSGLSRDGYTFSGWNTQADGMGTNYLSGTLFTPLEDTTLYARWSDGTEAYPIPLTANIWADGSITATAADSAVWYSFNVASGTSYSVWWNDGKNSKGDKTLDVKVSGSYSDATSIFTDIDSGFETAQSFTSNTSGTVLIKVTPYANGTTGSFALVYSTADASPTFYTVSFNANGGSGAIATRTVTAGSSVTLPDGSGLSKNGYTVSCWNANAAGNGSIYYTGSSFTTSNDTTLYALWGTPLTANIWADGDNSTSTVTDKAVWYSFPVASGGTYYVWWNDSVQGDAYKTLDAYVWAYYNNGATIFSSDSGWTSPREFTANRTGTVHIKVDPNWRDRTGTFAVTYTTSSAKPYHTITFDANGGSGTVNNRTIQPGSAITLPDGNGLSKGYDPSKGYDYIFDGWNTNADGTGTNYSAGSSYAPTGNITLYAKWNPAYTVTFHANGGKGTVPSPIKITQGRSITLPSGSGMTMSGCSLRGWNTSDFGTGINYNTSSSFTPTGNITLYAKWYMAEIPADNTWVHGSINATSAAERYTVWSSFNVVSGTTYYFWWNEKNGGDGTKTLDIQVSAYYSDGTNIFAADNGFINAQSFTAQVTGTVHIRVYPNQVSNNYGGTFAIAYTLTGAKPTHTVSFDLNGGSGPSHPYMTVPTGNTITLPDGSGMGKSGSWFDGWNTQSNGGGTNYAAGSSYKPTDNIRLYARWRPTYPYLIENRWFTNYIGYPPPTFKYWINAVSGTTYYIWWNGRFGSGGNDMADVAVSADYLDGPNIFRRVQSGWASPQSFTANRTGRVEITVDQYYTNSYGNFGITYTTSNTRPPFP